MHRHSTPCASGTQLPPAQQGRGQRRAEGLGDAAPTSAHEATCQATEEKQRTA